MKIIFDSENEKYNFIDDKCPRDISFDATELCNCGDYSKYPEGCPECWKNCGIGLEVKND